MSEYLIHYKPGSEKPDHKYVSRESKNGRWQYKYAEASNTGNTRSVDESNTDSEYYIDDNGRKRSVNGDDWIWNGEKPEEVEAIFENGDETNISFANDKDAARFEQLMKAWKASDSYKRTHNVQHSDTKGDDEMNNEDEKYYYLAHGESGSEWKQHLYTARNWVNGKWQYVYGNAKKATGIQQRHERDFYRKFGNKQDAYNASAKYDQTLLGKGEKALKTASKAVNDTKNSALAKIKDATGISQRHERDFYEKFGNKQDAYNASAKYDKTLLGRGENAAKNAGKALNKAKDIVSEYGKKTLNSIGKAKDSAVAKGKEIIGSLLKKRKKG